MMSCISTASHHTHNVNHGQIQVIFGPMFSGKTTELMRRMKRYHLAGYACLIVKYAKDVRYTDSVEITTHDRQKLNAESALTLKEIEKSAELVDIIGIDEGQFVSDDFSTRKPLPFPDIVTFSEEMASKGKIVIVAALDGTFQRVGFGSILELVPLAESVVKLNSVCMSCCGEASFTKRISSEKQIEVIGGADKYLAVCRRCFNDTNDNSESDKKSDFNDIRNFVENVLY